MSVKLHSSFQNLGSSYCSKNAPWICNCDFSFAFKSSTELGCSETWIFLIFWGEMTTRSHIIYRDRNTKLMYANTNLYAKQNVLLNNRLMFADALLPLWEASSWNCGYHAPLSLKKQKQKKNCSSPQIWLSIITLMAQSSESGQGNDQWSGVWVVDWTQTL